MRAALVAGHAHPAVPAVTDYQERAARARADLVALLAPVTPAEHQTAAWLLGWDVDTVTTLTGMIRRAVDQTTPALDDAAAVAEPAEHREPFTSRYADAYNAARRPMPDIGWREPSAGGAGGPGE